MNVEDSSSRLYSTDSAFQRLADLLSGLESPAITAFALARCIGRVLPQLDARWDRAAHRGITERLLSSRLLTPWEGGASVGYRIFGRSQSSAAVVACSLDPFAYVSHLSAMEHYGLTNRFARTLTLTRPGATLWRRAALAQMQRELGDDWARYTAGGLPQLVRPAYDRVGDLDVRTCERSHLGAFRLAGNAGLRVATIGRTFLEMLREPALCGGMQHVVDVFRSHAGLYLDLIVAEIESHGVAIDKVRGGYLLTEVCGLSSPVIEHWSVHAQRGGSRRLDPGADYEPVYSARWQLSVNVPSLMGQSPADAE